MTGPAASPDARLLKLIGEETRELRAFLDVLAGERQALAAGDADPLVDLARLKGEAAGRLASLAAARGALVAAAGAAPGAAGLAAWIDRQQGAAAGLRRAWQTLLELAREAHALNADNGTLIKVRLAHNQQALAVLMAASDQAALYGPDGQARAAPAGRRIDSA